MVAVAAASGAQAQDPAPTGPNAVARGPGAVATGEYSLAAGLDAAATNYYARATGWWSTASGGYAVASGFAAAASADYAVASGYTAIASSGFAQAPGYFSAATGWYSFAEGDYTTASGHFSRAFGYAATAGAPGHFAEVDGKVVTPRWTINEGPAEVDLRAYYAKGDRVQLAPGVSRMDYFPKNDPVGRAQLPELFVVADVSPTTLTFDHSPGAKWPRGFVSNLSRGMHQETHAAGTFDNGDRSGDAQASRYVARGITSGATVVRLTANGLEEACDNRIRLKWGQAIACSVRIVAESDQGDAACYYRRVLIKCSREGVTRIVGSVQTEGTDIVDETARAWSVELQADDENDALAILVTGAEGHAVRWVASLASVETAWFPRRPASP